MTSRFVSPTNQGVKPLDEPILILHTNRLYQYAAKQDNPAALRGFESYDNQHSRTLAFRDQAIQSHAPRNLCRSFAAEPPAWEQLVIVVHSFLLLVV